MSKLKAGVVVGAAVVVGIWGWLIVSQFQVGTHIHFGEGELMSPECPEGDGYLCPPHHPHACDLNFVFIED